MREQPFRHRDKLDGHALNNDRIESAAHQSTVCVRQTLIAIHLAPSYHNVASFCARLILYISTLIYMPSSQARLTFIGLVTAPFLAGAHEAAWPPATGAKVPLNAMEYPTTLAPQQVSMAQLIRDGATIVSSELGPNGPVITLKKGKKYLFCLVYGPVADSDQRVATSRCYALNP